MNKITVFILSLICLFIGAANFTANGQDKIRVQGKITDIATGEPIAAGNVIEDGYVVAYSDIDGNYVCTVPRSAHLLLRTVRGNQGEGGQPPGH